MKKNEKEKSKGSKIENESAVAILSYLLVGIIWYFIDEKMKKSEFAKFHVKQALNLLVIAVGISILLSIIGGILAVPFFSLAFGIVIAAVVVVINVVLFVLWLLGIIAAINSRKKEIPIIGQYAERYLTF